MKSVATTSSSRADFAGAVSRLPADIPRRHHGRYVQTGLDCVGLVLWLYREAGLPIDELDADYPENEMASPTRVLFMIERLSHRFRDVTGQARRGWFADGDVLLCGVDERAHLAIYVGGRVYQMSTNLHVLPVDRIRPYVQKAFRI